MSKPVCHDLSPMQDTATGLQRCFAQRIVPLEQQYLAGLKALSATLSGLQQMAELSPGQRDELNAWIDELDRRIITYQTLCANYLNTLNGEQPELMVSMLFGDARSTRAQKNLQEYIGQRSAAITRLRERMADLDSPDALKRQLQQRLQKEIHIRRFLDESTRYRPTRKAG